MNPLAWSASAMVLIAVAGPVPVGAATKTSIQLVNPDSDTAIRIYLDGVQIYQGTPDLAPGRVHETLPSTIQGSVDDRSRHAISVEALGTSAKAKLEWTPPLLPGAWIVIRYYPGAGTPQEPAFFTFALQTSPYLRK